VIQSLANPQCLNRYTYCLNNPLKYIDPSGYKVEFDTTGTGSYNSYDQMIKFAEAWMFFEVADPSLAYLLESSEHTVTFKWNELDNPNLPSSLNLQEALTDGASDFSSTGNIVVTLDFSIWQKADGDNGKYLSCTFGHEAFHTEMGFKSWDAGIRDWQDVDNSVAEEAFAYSLGDTMAINLGISNKYRHNFSFNPYISDSYNNDALRSANGYLWLMGYGNMPYWPPTGKEILLNVAQEAWWGTFRWPQVNN
jgi:hypothetical protein